VSGIPRPDATGRPPAQICDSGSNGRGRGRSSPPAAPPAANRPPPGTRPAGQLAIGGRGGGDFRLLYVPIAPTRTASLTNDGSSPLDDVRARRRERAAADAAPLTAPTTATSSWLLRLAESKANYWATYPVDLALMLFFLAWDAVHLHVGAAALAGWFLTGVFVWTFTEYAFHRWMYHVPGLAITRWGHDKHHADPTAYVALPFLVTPVLFLPLQQLAGNWFAVRGLSAVLAGWFAGFIAYSFFHHALHHYRLPYAWYRHLQSQHRIHHAIPDVNFGVTMRGWDRVFRTEFRKRV
jgi:Fatty acid hydroxylase